MLTCGALTYASLELRKGNRETFQRALRYRVAFQTATVAAAAASLFWIKGPSVQPPTHPDGTPAPNPRWNQEKTDRREMEEKIDWGKRYREAHARDAQEHAAIQRMVEEEIQARQRQAAAQPPPPPVPTPTHSDVPEAAGSAETTEPAEPRGPLRIGQDKRRFTFHS